MTIYQKTLADIYDLQEFAIKLGLENICALTEHLGNPHETYPVIHVAGTNGKGSTAFFVAQILKSMGLKTGLYTSPHLVDFRERIRIDETLIDTEFIINFWSDLKNLVHKRKATFFDVTTALAFDYFKYHNVDVAVVETGLGGRLDSTNIVNPELILITPIQFDHEKQLGRNLTSIASEKAGIFKQNSVIFSAKQHPIALHALKERVPSASRLIYLADYITTRIQKADLQGTYFSLQDRYFNDHFDSVFCLQPGDFQIHNLSLGYFAARYYLDQKNITFMHDNFQHIISNTAWPGRLQTISHKPHIIFDVSHNYHGIRKTVSFLESVTNKNRVLLIGLVKDKNYRKIARYLSGRFRKIIITEPETHRKLEGITLKKVFDNLQQDAIFVKDLKEAYDLAKIQLRTTETLLIIGSHYLIGAYLQDSN